MQLISIFLMQVLEWVPSSISQTGTSTGTGTTLGGEDSPHVWRWLQEWQESGGLTCPKAAVSICSITRMNTTNPMLQVWDNLLVTQILEYDKTVFDQFEINCSCSFAFYVTEININHCKSSIFLFQSVTTTFGMNFKSYDPCFSVNLVSCFNFNWATTQLD